MAAMQVTRLQTGEGYVFRALQAHDAERLGRFFDALSQETRRRYAPHPLTAEFARELCRNADDATVRLLLLTRDEGEVIGYFILKPSPSAVIRQRYSQYGIRLEDGLDMEFAPCVADAHQSRGLASLAMPLIAAEARRVGARSLVLMGGTQASNHRAIHFYEKVGFRRLGAFTTTIENYDMRLPLT